MPIRRLVEYWIEENGWDIDVNPSYFPYPDREPMTFWESSLKVETYFSSQCGSIEKASNESSI